MAIAQEIQPPVYDDRVNEILQKLAAGMTREELSEQYKYSDYRSLDMYMRRRGFTWDRDKQTYVPSITRLDHVDLDMAASTSSKVGQVISLFSKEGADAKSIAKRLGFSDHRELATYMKGRGYVWSAEKGNYVKQYGPIDDDDTHKRDAARQAEDVTHLGAEAIPAVLQRFLPLLEMLERQKDRLVDLLIPASETGKIPRYAVPGVYVTKSVHMTNTLDLLVRDFSREKNISQRDIFAVALIEFFRRYGYEREVEKLLGQR